MYLLQITSLCHRRVIVYRYSWKQQFKKRQSSQSSLSLFFSLLLDLVMMKSLEFLANKGEYIQAISRSCGTFLEHHAPLQGCFIRQKVLSNYSIDNTKVKTTTTTIRPGIAGEKSVRTS